MMELILERKESPKSSQIISHIRGMWEIFLYLKTICKIIYSLTPIEVLMNQSFR